MARGEPCRRRHASCLSDFGRNLIRSHKAVKLKMNAWGSEAASDFRSNPNVHIDPFKIELHSFSSVPENGRRMVEYGSC
jgi:hypothetical protein